MHSPVAETVNAFDLLDNFLIKWLEAVGEIRRLAQRQLKEIADPTNDTSLTEVLAQKEQAYRIAQDLSEEVKEIKEYLAQLKWEKQHAHRRNRLEAMEEAIYEGLKDLADIEDRSQTQMQSRLQAARMLLENHSQSRRITHLYGNGETATPRFLDQKR
jgi:hypothetical protein